MTTIIKKNRGKQPGLFVWVSLSFVLAALVAYMCQHVFRSSLYEKGGNTEETLRTKLEEETKKTRYYQEYQRRIHNRIQSLSRRLLLEKFGPGPHYVEIQVAIDPKSNIYDPYKDGTQGIVEGTHMNLLDDHKIVVELSSVDDMPHTVYWFLEQVARGLYNGTSFHRNAEHVLQGGPIANFLTFQALHKHQGQDNNSDENHMSATLEQRFQENGLDSLLFQEYSPNHPHVKYTLGYAGRPGGPDWYINLQDNTENHGPGGQDSYEDPTEADPCFGKVISGFDVIDRIHASEVEKGSYRRMKVFVAVMSMTIRDK